MTDLLEELGEQWRAVQPPPPEVDTMALHARRRWPAITVAAVLVAGIAVGATSLVDHQGRSAPASLTATPGQSAPSAPDAFCHAADITLGTVIFDSSMFTTSYVSIPVTSRRDCTLRAADITIAGLADTAPTRLVRLSAATSGNITLITPLDCRSPRSPSPSVVVGDTSLNFGLPNGISGLRLCAGASTFGISAQPTAPPAPITRACSVTDLYGTVDGEQAANGFSYEIALTNIGTTACQLTGGPVSIAGETASGGLTDLHLRHGETLPEKGPALAPPGEPIHVTVHAGGGCPAEGQKFTSLRLGLPGGTTVPVSVNGIIGGGVRLACAPDAGNFFGPISAYTGKKAAALPMGPACTASGLRVTGIAYDHVLAGEGAWDVAVAPTSGTCIVRFGDLNSSLITADGGDNPTGVPASPAHPAHIGVGTEDDSGCTTARHTASLQLTLQGQLITTAPPTTTTGSTAGVLTGRAGTFTTCVEGTALALDAGGFTEHQGR